MSWEPNPFKLVVMFMMTNIQTAIKKILQPLALAIAMLFLTPIFGLLHVALYALPTIQLAANETVIFKTEQTSVAFKN